MSDENTIAPDRTALRDADRIGRAAAATGFDWPDALQALEKVREEVEELDAAIRSGSRSEIVDEFGDLLFAASSVARLLDLDAESALHQATSKFERRFETMCDLIRQQDRELAEMTLPEMEEFWQHSKSFDPS